MAYLRNILPIYATVVVLMALLPVAQADEESVPSLEYRVKAAFLYNFFEFVEWPKEINNTNEPIIIGILGKDPFDNAFDEFKHKLVGGKKVIIQRFKGLAELKKNTKSNQEFQHPEINAMCKCRMLFVCKSERKEIREIVKYVHEHHVMTIADTPGFAESGVIINFVIKENKVRFEINTASARKAKLTIRAQLLRLATKIVKDQPDNSTED